MRGYTLDGSEFNDTDSRTRLEENDFELNLEACNIGWITPT